MLFAQTAIFWIRHRDIDEDAYMTYDTESDSGVEDTKGREGESAVIVGEKATPPEST